MGIPPAPATRTTTRSRLADTLMYCVPDSLETVGRAGFIGSQTKTGSQLLGPYPQPKQVLIDNVAHNVEVCDSLVPKAQKGMSIGMSLVSTCTLSTNLD